MSHVNDIWNCVVNRLVEEIKNVEVKEGVKVFVINIGDELEGSDKNPKSVSKYEPCGPREKVFMKFEELFKPADEYYKSHSIDIDWNFTVQDFFSKFWECIESGNLDIVNDFLENITVFYTKNCKDRLNDNPEIEKLIHNNIEDGMKVYCEDCEQYITTRYYILFKLNGYKNEIKNDRFISSESCWLIYQPILDMEFNKESRKLIDKLFKNPFLIKISGNIEGNDETVQYYLSK